MRKKAVRSVPIRILMGWQPAVTEKDAVVLAKGFIQKRFNARDVSWYVVREYMGGVLWEAHEGGPGRGYADAVITSLKNDPGAQPWFRSGERVMRAMLRDGKPFVVMLPAAEGNAVIEGDADAIVPNTRMKAAVHQGTAVMALGGVLFGASMLSMAAAGTMFVLAANPGPGVRPVEIADLPHLQWDRVRETPVQEVVTKLEFKDGSWSVASRPHGVAGWDGVEEASTISPIDDSSTDGGRVFEPAVDDVLAPTYRSDATPMPFGDMGPNMPAQPIYDGSAQIDVIPADDGSSAYGVGTSAVSVGEEFPVEDIPAFDTVPSILPEVGLEGGLMNDVITNLPADPLPPEASPVPFPDLETPASSEVPLTGTAAAAPYGGAGDPLASPPVPTPALR